MQAYWLVTRASLAKESDQTWFYTRAFLLTRCWCSWWRGYLLTPWVWGACGCVRLQGKGEAQKENRFSSSKVPAVGRCCSFNKKVEVGVTVKRWHLSTTLKVRGLTVSTGGRREFPQREQPAPRPECGLWPGAFGEQGGSQWGGAEGVQGQRGGAGNADGAGFVGQGEDLGFLLGEEGVTAAEWHGLMTPSLFLHQKPSLSWERSSPWPFHAWLLVTQISAAVVPNYAVTHSHITLFWFPVQNLSLADHFPHV